MTKALILTTPQQAYREMVAAGAAFDVRRREDCLGISFGYRVVSGGAAQRCREVLAAVKARPPIFMQAFRAAVQDGAVGGVSTPPTSPASMGEVETTPSISRRADGGKPTKVVATTSLVAKGDVETSPYLSGAEEGVSAPSITRDDVEDVQTSSTADRGAA